MRVRVPRHTGDKRVKVWRDEPGMIGASAEQLNGELSDPDRGPEGSTALNAHFCPKTSNTQWATSKLPVVPPKLALGARDLAASFTFA